MAEDARKRRGNAVIKDRTDAKVIGTAPCLKLGLRVRMGEVEDDIVAVLYDCALAPRARQVLRSRRLRARPPMGPRPWRRAHRAGPSAPSTATGRRPLRPQPPSLLRPMLYVGKPTILFGQGGVGKSSAIAAAIVVSVRTGVAALDAWEVVDSGEVLVLDWEGDADDWNDAVDSIDTK